MASPTYNGNPIFDSYYSGGAYLDGDNNFCQGVLEVMDYQQISQEVHFEGGIGTTTLWHGYPPQSWQFTGLISAYTTTVFDDILSGIQDAIDAANTGTYYTLVDTFGNSYANAQVRSLAKTSPTMHRAEGGYVVAVVVKGLIQNNTHFGGDE